MSAITSNTPGEGTLVEGWNIRAYRDGDVPGIVTLANATFAFDKRDRTMSIEEMERGLAMPHSDPPRQVIVVDGAGVEGMPEGVFAGYGRIMKFEDVENDERLYQFNLYVHPAARGKGLERVLLARLMGIARGAEVDPATEARSKVYAMTMCSERNASLKPVLVEVGLKDVRQHWIMERSLEGPIAEPQAIEGVNIRTYRLPEDNEAALRAYNSSFVDHFEFHAFPEEMWDHMAGRPETRSELSWVAEVAERPGEIAGFCMCEIKEEDNRQRGRSEGWIALLGTVREWRGKGLGRSLLLHGLHSLKGAGMTTALLGVDSENLTGANRLYESVGFRVREHEILYKSSLGEVRV
ncbi:MAG: GNAT family N-acetyltransferase [Chloroflexia bacterium]